MLPSPASPVLFSYGPIEIRFYGLIILSGLLCAYFICRRLMKYRSLSAQIIDDFLLWGVFAGILGARAYYVIFQWSYFKDNLSEVFAIWQGGLAIHGAIIASVVAAIIFCLKRRISFLAFADIGSIGLILGQAFGRWGNYFNQEAFGRPSDLPWAIFIKESNRPAEFISSQYFHPTFLYESILNFILFFVLVYLLKGNKVPKGGIFALYLIFYSLSRFFIESLRTDSLMLADFRVAQLISMLLVVIGIVLFRYSYRMNK